MGRGEDRATAAAVVVVVVGHCHKLHSCLSNGIPGVHAM